MKKPWMEEWRLEEGFGGIVTPGAYITPAPDYEEPLDEDKQRLRLAAAAPDLVRALLVNEWGGEYGYEGEHPSCSSCHGVEPRSYAESGRPYHNRGHTNSPIEGHHPNCALDAALTKAGLPPHDREAARAALREPARAPVVDMWRKGKEQK